MIYTVKRSNAHFFTGILLFTLLSSVKSLNVKGFPYSIFNMEADTDSLLKLSENSERTTEHIDHELNRRGYAGDDFYQKASKSIPRIGRRGLRLSTDHICNCKPFKDIETDENSQPEKIENSEKPKRPYMLPDKTVWPWHTDRVPNYTKRREAENCYYLPKIGPSVADFEFCNDDFICCPPIKDVSLWKRIIQTYPSKQKVLKPNYKNNQYM